MIVIFFYVEGRWLEAEVERLDINAFELAAMNIGSFTFLQEARRRGIGISHLCEFTDNTSAEYAEDRGKPSSARLTELVTRRYDAQGCTRWASAARASEWRLSIMTSPTASRAVARCWPMHCAPTLQTHEPCIRLVHERMVIY